MRLGNDPMFAFRLWLRSPRKPDPCADTPRRRHRLGLVLALFAFATFLGCGEPDPAAAPEPAKDQPEGEARLPAPGGTWTRPRQPGPTYVAPAWHLNADERLAFFTGFSFFRSPWVAAPSSTTARDGLGPLFNSHSCDGCHRNGGRGRSLLDDPHSLATVVRISVAGDDGALGPHPRYGSQLQVKSTYRRQGEASLAMSEESVPAPGTASGGGDLRSPRLQITPYHDEEDPARWRASARVAPALLGMGLLEAIPESDLLARADPDDADRDGISGRPHWRMAGATRAVGRFGWKALHPSVTAQTGAALRDDIGITNHEATEAGCTVRQSECRAAPNGNDPAEGVEIARHLFDYLVHFVAHLPPPKGGRITNRVRRGQDAFTGAGCAGCHRPHFDTVYGRIWPYSDLLLHDMGPGLADHRPEGDATGFEWRTPPLWGIGTAKKVSGHTTLLHDGRARNVREAILWHGGEATPSRAAFQRLPAETQADLLAFVNAL